MKLQHEYTNTKTLHIIHFSNNCASFMRSVVNFAFSKKPFTELAGRRSVVHSLNGMGACLQPHAAIVGQEVLAA